MLWVLLLASPAFPSSAYFAAPTPPPEVDVVGAREGMTRLAAVEVGGAEVIVSTDVAQVGRPTRVPVQLVARNRLGTTGSAAEPVVAFVCLDPRCELTSSVSLTLNGPAVVVEAVMWPSGLQLRFRHLGVDAVCCGSTGRSTRVVATTGPPAAPYEVRYAPNVDGTGGVTVVSAGGALRARPSLADSFSAIIIGDGYVIDDALAAALERAARRGVIVSLPMSSPLFKRVAGGNARELRAEPLDVAVDDRRDPLVVTEGSFDVDVGGGAFIGRPPGADDRQSLAGVLAGRTWLMLLPQHAATGDSVAVRAAGTGLLMRPHRGAALLLGALCVAGIAWSVRSARKRGWRAALVAAAIVGVAGSVALVLLEVVTVPAERHERVIAWIGPNAAWEVGVDAVRPRTERVVTATAPMEPMMWMVLGDEDRRPPGAVQATGGVDAEGARSVSLRVASESGLALLWERPIDDRVEAPVAIVDGVVENRLGVPLRALQARQHHDMVGPVPARGRSVIDELPLVDAGGPFDITARERRLLEEITGGCARRVSAMKISTNVCAAAIATLDDGTLLGIEVSR